MAAAMVIAPISGASITMNLTNTINGSTPTGTGSLPFLTATFSQVSPGMVDLTMINTMPATNFVKSWMFNIDSFQTLTVAYQSGVAATVTQGSNFSNGGNQLKAGLFDLFFEFPTPGNQIRFNGNPIAPHAKSVYRLSGTGITEATFTGISVPDGNVSGGYISAADVAGFGSSGSIGTRSAVPEPASIVAIALGVAGLIRRRATK